MANTSILAAFERMWQHITSALALKADKTEIVQSDWSQNDESVTDYIKNKPEIATDDEIIDMLAQEDLIAAVADADGSILADENKSILIW